MSAYIDILKQAAEQQKQSDKIESYTLKYLPFILRRVQKKHAKHYAIYKFDDLLDAAVEGALKAEKRYQPSKGTDFSTYARYDIDGAMDSFITNNTKTQLILYKKILQFVEEYVNGNSIYPSDIDIIKGVGITTEKYKELLTDMEPVHFVSYTTIREDGSEEELGIDEYTGEDNLLSVDILKVLSTMDKETQDIIKIFCIEELSLNEIMHRFKISKPEAQSRVTQAKEKFKMALLDNGIGI